MLGSLLALGCLLVGIWGLVCCCCGGAGVGGGSRGAFGYGGGVGGGVGGGAIAKECWDQSMSTGHSSHGFSLSSSPASLHFCSPALHLLRVFAPLCLV